MGSGIEIERQGKKTSFHAQAAQDGLQAAKRGRQVVRGAGTLKNASTALLGALQGIPGSAPACLVCRRPKNPGRRL